MVVIFCIQFCSPLNQQNSLTQPHNAANDMTYLAQFQAAIENIQMCACLRRYIISTRNAFACLLFSFQTHKRKQSHRHSWHEIRQLGAVNEAIL